jgi:hypothetical protein
MSLITESFDFSLFINDKHFVIEQSHTTLQYNQGGMTDYIVVLCVTVLSPSTNTDESP